MASRKAASDAATDRFAGLFGAVVPAPATVKAPRTPPALTDEIRSFAKTLLDAGQALLINVSGWTPEQIDDFEDTLRGNRGELFPEHRIRMERGDVDGVPTIKVSLGRLGQRKEGSE